ncbi:MAG TPA: hypothetical protein VG265_14185 [Gaiellaceae bacterium]|jgi:hypothetical protein|nr:hypothetical protein [Gaiellaceae bacterium]
MSADLIGSVSVAYFLVGLALFGFVCGLTGWLLARPAEAIELQPPARPFPPLARPSAPPADASNH